jgi:hypothetical protein
VAQGIATAIQTLQVNVKHQIQGQDTLHTTSLFKIGQQKGLGQGQKRRLCLQILEDRSTVKYRQLGQTKHEFLLIKESLRFPFKATDLE